MSSDAMAKTMFLELDWPAEEAVRAAKASGGDWHQLRAQQQLGATAVGPPSFSKKDDCLANESPCFIANRLLNGTAPETCPLDPCTMAWVVANMPTHCDDLELLAQKQDLLATSAAGLFTGGPTAEELFTRASGCRSKRVRYQQSLYRNPWAKDDAAVQEIATSFNRRRMTFSDGLRERARLEERGASSCDAEAAKTAKAKPKPKVKAKAKARAKKQPA